MPSRTPTGAALSTNYQGASALLGVSDQTVRQWVREGKLRAHYLNKRVVRIPLEDIYRLAGLDFDPVAYTLEQEAIARARVAHNDAGETDDLDADNSTLTSI